MINLWYFVLFLFFYVINIKSDWYGLRPDTIYLSYFFFGLVVITLVLNLKVLSNRNLVNFNEELTYYIKMSMFFYLLVLDSLKSNYTNLHSFLSFYKSLISLIFEKYITSNKTVHDLRLRKKYYYFYMFCDRCLVFEQMTRKFIQQLFIKNVIQLTRFIIFRTQKTRKLA
jgi:hypothetical protein